MGNAFDALAMMRRTRSRPRRNFLPDELTPASSRRRRFLTSSPPRHRLAGRGIARFLAGASPFDATSLACEWATSPQRERRLAIALALQWNLHFVGADFVLEQLVCDPDPEVRDCAAHALQLRRGNAPTP